VKFVNTVELKNHLNAVLGEVSRGETVIVTLRGQPTATLLHTTEEDLDQVLFEKSALVRSAVREGLQDLKAGRFTTLKQYAARRFGRKSR
jgi:antitoxin (DNA-binding transcriptional repressor) of toxin-antitoxin stability system